tara:strand:+ start:337 stop:663 length:327 start_codon:yes stop_codon:yes gene_type:complete
MNIEDIRKRNEKEFKKNMENVHMRLTGDNKYYYANQCRAFIEHVERNGWYARLPEDILGVTIVYSVHYGASINARLRSGGETHIKTFNDKKEMLGFICGYNFATYGWR